MTIWAGADVRNRHCTLAVNARSFVQNCQKWWKNL